MGFIEEGSAMSTQNTSQTNSLLGYPDDARLLLVNADDFGMCHAVNEAIIRSLQHGIVRSTSVMVPWSVSPGEAEARRRIAMLRPSWFQASGAEPNAVVRLQVPDVRRLASPLAAGTIQRWEGVGAAVVR